MDNNGVQSILYNKAIKNDSIESFGMEKTAHPLNWRKNHERAI